jgi:transcriptional regulator with XRE-family HTH domain
MADEQPPPVPWESASEDDIAARRHAFGRRLHAARHHRGVALEDIAQATKVSASLLAALERGDASRWPKGIFRRAFFRDYVAAIGLPADPHVSEFLQLFPDGEDHPSGPTPVPEAAPGLRLTLAPSSRWHVTRDRVRRELIDLIPILLLVIAVTAWFGGTLATAAGLFALSYSGRLIALITRDVIPRRRRRSGSGQMPSGLH